jgi:hypothetical protein
MEDDLPRRHLRRRPPPVAPPADRAARDDGCEGEKRASARERWEAAPEGWCLLSVSR